MNVISTLWERTFVRETLLVFATVSVLHLLFFWFSEIIWVVGELPPSELLTHTLAKGAGAGLRAEHDGIEAFVLHGFCWILAGIGWFSRRIPTKSRWFFLAFVILTGLFIWSSEIRLPNQMFLLGKGKRFLPHFIGAVSIVIVAVGLFLRKTTNLKICLIFGLIFLLCFISSSPPVSWDYTFSLAPGNAIVWGQPIRETFMQYDLVLAGTSATILWLGLDPNLLQILAQTSFFVCFLVCFYLGKKIFRNQRQAILFVLCLLVFRYLSDMQDPIAEIQECPIRIDWWLLLALIIWRKGLNHWGLGLALAFVLIFHRNFGLLYTLVLYQWAGLEFFTMSSRVWWLRWRWVFVGIFVGFVGILLVFGTIISPEVSLYQSLKIGFLRVKETSFFWWILCLTGFGAALIRRANLPPRVIDFCKAVLVLNISQLFYFLGRSHDNYLLNTSVSWLMLLFLCLMIIEELLANSSQKYAFRLRKVIYFFPLFLIWAGGIAYATGIKNKVFGMTTTIQKGKTLVPFKRPTSAQLAVVRLLTNNQEKVYFYGFEDAQEFWMTLDGNYRPRGYFQPYGAWPLKRELNIFLQGLLDEGYFLVTQSPTEADSVQPHLNYTNYTCEEGFIVVSKPHYR